MIDSTNPRVMADNIRHLSGESGSQASDISALQTTVTSLGAYSEDETDTGMKWIDGSPIYRKVFYIAQMPDGSLKTKTHNIVNLGVVISLYGIAQAEGTFHGKQFPYSGALLLTYTSTNIEYSTTSNQGAKSAYIIIEYTKSAAPSPDLAPAPDDTRSIEPEVREEDPEAEPVIDEPIEEPVKKTTTRKKTTTTE